VKQRTLFPHTVPNSDLDLPAHL